MNPRTLLVAIVLVGTISGCSNIPESTKDQLALAIPDGWAARAATKPVADSSWVEKFNDPQLNALVDEAIESNRNLQSVAARIKSAKANVAIAGSNFFPQFDSDLSGNRNSRNFIGFPFRGGDAGDGAPDPDTPVIQSTLSNSFGVNLNVSWEIDIWGRIRSGKKAAIADLQATRADYEAAKLSLAAQTSKVWFGLVAAKEQVRLSKRALEIFRTTEETIRGQFERGVNQEGQDTAAQLQLSLADIANARASLESQLEQEMRLQRQLEVLLGRYPKGQLKSASQLASVPAIPAAGIPSEVLDRRPDLFAAERRLAAADKRILEAKRSLLPRLALTSNYGTSTPQFEQVFNSNFEVWGFAGNATQPIFQGGRLVGNVQMRKAEAEQALASYQETALQAFREVEQALAAERFLRNRQIALQQAVKFNQSAYDRARDDYANGVGDVLTLLRAQQQLIQSESQLIDARRARLENRIDLHIALGGDFRLGEPVEEAEPAS